MSDRSPTPEEATRSLRELSRWQQHVTGTPPPRWLYLLVVAALPVAGAARDLWPQHSAEHALVAPAVVLAYLYLPRFSRVGSALGYRVMPGRRPPRGSLLGRRYAVLAAALVVYVLGEYLVHQLRPAYPNTIVDGAVALVIAGSAWWTYPSRTAPEPARDDA